MVVSARLAFAAFRVLFFVLLTAGAASAQVGVGARLSFLRSSDSVSNAPRTRYTGGFIRAHTSPRTALELALDYRTTTDAQQVRVRDIPIQASLLLYPVRSGLSIYFLGGIGWYNQKMDVPGSGSSSASRTGYHAGLGGSLQLGRHAAVHIDYRYTFLHTGDSQYPAGAVPFPGTISIQEKLKLSHEGSMWTTGVTVYF